MPAPFLERQPADPHAELEAIRDISQPRNWIADGYTDNAAMLRVHLHALAALANLRRDA